jgi:hypothetical protein
MRDPLLSTTAGDPALPTDTVLRDTVLRDTVLGRPVPPADAEEPAPSNRAARRGRSGKKTRSGAVLPGAPSRARAAQGRRINPVRRTG